MFRQVILKLSSVKKGINIAKDSSQSKTTVPTSLYEVNIISLKNIVESIKKKKNRWCLFNRHHWLGTDSLAYILGHDGDGAADLFILWVSLFQID